MNWRRSLLAGAWLTALAFGGTVGCAHGETDSDRRLQKLRDELSRVQADRDRVDQRLVALESQIASNPAESSSSPPASAPSKNGKSASASTTAAVVTPPLRVVRLGADGTPATEVTAVDDTASSIDDDTARPVLRVVGGASPRVRGRGRTAGSGARDTIVETLPDESASAEGAPSIRERAPRPSALDPEARRAYDDALALVRAKKCGPALDAFAGFIVRWPDHPNADNAMYWRGECYVELGDLPRAVEQFEGTIARFPLGNKVPDALLKLGLSYQKLGNQARAQDAFERLLREYPKSEARRKIPQGAASTP
ncbi:MAG: tol-pal system protein YbgF [Polyangiaceae bacterium]